MGDAWFEQALGDMKAALIGELIGEINEQPQVDMMQEVVDQVVIDIRITKISLEGAGMYIPFNGINKKFPLLAQRKD